MVLSVCDNSTGFARLTASTGVGHAVERYVYDPPPAPEAEVPPEGRVSIFSGTGTARGWVQSRKNEILFAGYRYNPETGSYQVRHCEYHPTVGRFMQRDPLGYVDGGNLYEYVRSMPTGAVDPMGLAATQQETVEKLVPVDNLWSNIPDQLSKDLPLTGRPFGQAGVRLVEARNRIAIAEAQVEEINSSSNRGHKPDPRLADLYATIEENRVRADNIAQAWGNAYVKLSCSRDAIPRMGVAQPGEKNAVHRAWELETYDRIKMRVKASLQVNHQVGGTLKVVDVGSVTNSLATALGFEVEGERESSRRLKSAYSSSTQYENPSNSCKQCVYYYSFTCRGSLWFGWDKGTPGLDFDIMQERRSLGVFTSANIDIKSGWVAPGRDCPQAPDQTWFDDHPLKR